MTCVVGLVADGRVWIGADSATTWESGRVQITRNPKVFRVGPLLIGSSGSGRVQNVLRGLTVPKRPRGVRAFAYISLHVVGAIRKALVEAGSIIPAAAGAPDSLPDSSCILIGYKGGLYSLDERLSCDELATEADAIGTGAPWALGRLAAPGDPKARVLAALREAEKNCCYVRRPFKVESI